MMSNLDSTPPQGQESTFVNPFEISSPIEGFRAFEGTVAIPDFRPFGEELVPYNEMRAQGLPFHNLRVRIVMDDDAKVYEKDTSGGMYGFLENSNQNVFAGLFQSAIATFFRRLIIPTSRKDGTEKSSKALGELIEKAEAAGDGKINLVILHSHGDSKPNEGIMIHNGKMLIPLSTALDDIAKSLNLSNKSKKIPLLLTACNPAEQLASHPCFEILYAQGDVQLGRDYTYHWSK